MSASTSSSSSRASSLPGCSCGSGRPPAGRQYLRSTGDAAGASFPPPPSLSSSPSSPRTGSSACCPGLGRRSTADGLRSSWSTSTSRPRERTTSPRTTAVAASELLVLVGRRAVLSGLPDPVPAGGSSPYRVSMRVRLTVGLLVVIVASFALSVMQTSTNPTVAFFSPFTAPGSWPSGDWSLSGRGGSCAPPPRWPPL